MKLVITLILSSIAFSALADDDYYERQRQWDQQLYQQRMIQQAREADFNRQIEAQRLQRSVDLIRQQQILDSNPSPYYQNMYRQ
jgi:hypothetical protein